MADVASNTVVAYWFGFVWLYLWDVCIIDAPRAGPPTAVGGPAHGRTPYRGGWPCPWEVHLPRWVALPMGGPPTAVGGPALGAFHVMAVLGVGCPPGNDLGLGSGSC